MIKRMQFDSNRTLAAPNDIFMREDKSTGPILRQEYVSIARHSASSCFLCIYRLRFGKWSLMQLAKMREAAMNKKLRLMR
jgi:hypothetical protein